MTRDTRIALFLMGELVAALRANDPDAFRGLLSEGIQELGVTEVKELLPDWLYSFLTAEEQEKLLLGWYVGVSLQPAVYLVQSQGWKLLKITFRTEAAKIYRSTNNWAATGLVDKIPFEPFHIY